MARPPSLLPDKLFFRIGEVADLVGVRPHVLRYWEEEFGILKPMKTRGAHRQYRRRDVELALVIKRLLHDEGFTVAGARKRLRELGLVEAIAIARQSEPPEPARSSSRETELRGELLALRADLVSLLARFDEEVDEERALPARAERSGADVLVVHVEASRTSDRRDER